MKIKLTTLIIILITSTFISMANEFKTPDFAYPKQVAKDSEKELKNAIKNGNDIATIRAVMNLTLAESQVSNTSLKNNLSKIQEIKDSNASSPVLKAMSALIMADIYKDIYMENRWNYDRRELPLLPLPKDYNEWSGEQFRTVIFDLLKEAVSRQDALAAEKISDYSGVLKFETAKTAVYYPTLFDFVANYAVEAVTDLAEVANVPGIWMCTEFEFLSLQNRIADEHSSFVIDVFKSLLKSKKPGSIDRLVADINRLEWLSYRSLGNGERDPEVNYHTALLQLYNDYSDRDFSAIPLLKFKRYASHEQEQKIYELALEWISKFPNSDYAANITNLIDDLENQSMTVQVPSYVAPGVDFTATISYSNAPKVRICVYKLKENSNSYYERYKIDKLVKEYVIEDSSKFLFSKKTKLQIQVPDFGIYAIVPSYRPLSKTEMRDFYEHSRIVRATRIKPMMLFLPGDKCGIYAADIITGMPLRDVSVFNDKLNLITDYKGYADVPNRSKIKLAKGEDRFNEELYFNEYHAKRGAKSATFATDLPIYHPGDTMQWVMTLAAMDSEGNKSVCKDEAVEVTVRDANYQIISSKEYVTDNYGRATDKIKLPETGLTGHFTIQCRHGNHTFMVSEYKLPTFAAKITDIQRNMPAEGCVTVKGVAADYSGFPIADADVKVTLSEALFFRFYGTDNDIFTAQVKTDSAGAFTFVIEKGEFEKSNRSFFCVNCDVTSPAGETRSCSQCFSTGKPYYITFNSQSDLGEGFELDIEKPQSLNINVITPMGESVRIPLVVKLFSGEKIVFEKEIASPEEVIDFGQLDNAFYDLEISPVDASLADTYKAKGLLYNLQKQEFNADLLFWTPNKTLKFASGKGTVYFASNRDSLMVNMIVADGKKVLLQRWVQLEKGIGSTSFTLPDSIQEAQVYFMGVNNLNTYSETRLLVNPDAKQKFNLTVETFRDNVTPGSTETLKLRTSYSGEIGVPSAVFLNMFSKAISDIYPHASLAVPSFYDSRDIRVSIPDEETVSWWYHGKVKSFEVELYLPELNLWNLSWLGNRRFRDLNVMYCMAPTAMAKGMVADNVMEDAVAAPAPVGEEMYDEAVAESAVDGDGGGDNSATHIEEYRPSEEPLALFEPMLTTDESGNLEFTFTYPQSATTWVMNMMAYTENLLSASETRQVIASRPLMVKCALPRFVRQGDKVTLAATVMNNTDKALQDVNVTINLLNTATGESIASLNDTVSLDAMGSCVVKLPVEVNMAGVPLLFRIKASADGNSDGEQNLIATLESAQPVIESRPFYMGAKDSSVTVPIPRGANAKVTLEFFENPTWSVVTALPGLREGEPLTSPSAAGAIFSAAVADGIMKKNPDIASAIRFWQQSDKSDSTLVSMLEKNADLKIVLLECTPWMQDAMNDTQRMTRLALLFDKKETERVINNAVEVLAKLQKAGGGWAWSAYGTEASEWATQNVLAAFAMLRQLGYYPSGKILDDMVKNAVLFLDARIAERNKLAKCTLPDILYTYTRQYYSDIRQSSASKKTSDLTIQEIVSDWKSYPLHEKALAAIILNRADYPSTAREILRSINEFSSSDPAKGMWWDNLESRCWWATSLVSTNALILNAYNEISPKSADVDLIRQWLLLEKCRNDWGDAVATSHAIVAILDSGSDWLVPASTRCVVRVNENIVEPEKIDKITGHFRTDISSLVTAPSVLHIDKVAEIPAYGGLYSIFTQRMEDVKSSRCDELSVEKRFLVKRLTTDGEKWEETDTFAVGDVVKVSLTIKATESMSYVAIVDNRPACLEPVNQLPTPIWCEGIYFYRETRNDKSNIFIDFLPKGTFILEQEFTVTHLGEFASGLATAQSQYAPQFSAHSAGTLVKVKK